MNRIDLVGIILMFLFLLSVALFVYYESGDCSDIGGSYVRGVIWFKCV